MCHISDVQSKAVDSGDCKLPLLIFVTRSCALTFLVSLQTCRIAHSGKRAVCQPLDNDAISIDDAILSWPGFSFLLTEAHVSVFRWAGRWAAVNYFSFQRRTGFLLVPLTLWVIHYTVTTAKQTPIRCWKCIMEVQTGPCLTARGQYVTHLKDLHDKDQCATITDTAVPEKNSFIYNKLTKTAWKCIFVKQILNIQFGTWQHLCFWGSCYRIIFKLHHVILKPHSLLNLFLWQPKMLSDSKVISLTTARICVNITHLNAGCTVKLIFGKPQCFLLSCVEK